MWDVQSLFRSHSQELMRFLRRRVASPAMAADLTQDAFLALLTVKTHQITDGRAYLFRTAANLAINHNRRESILSFTDDADTSLANLPDDAPSPERIVLSRQELALICEVLDDLSDMQRRIFILSRIDGLTYEAIGQRLRISSKTAFSHMVRILVRMQLQLDAARE